MTDLETLLRELAAPHLEIVLQLDGARFTAEVQRYPTWPRSTDSSIVKTSGGDPVAALRKALVECLRLDTDSKRRYEAAAKVGPDPRQINIEEALVAMASLPGDGTDDGTDDEDEFAAMLG